MLAVRNEGGRWQVSLPRGLEPDEHAKLLRWMAAQTELLRALAADVRAGKYPSVPEVDRARREKTRELAATMSRNE